MDTMIVRHLCAAGAGDKLGEAFAGRLAWPEAVQAELAKQARGIPALATFLARRPATVLEVPEDREQEVEDIRIDMYTKGAARLSPTEHLGEAQCLFFAEREGYALATNDGRARSRARASWDDRRNEPRVPGHHRVDVFHTIDVLQVLILSGQCRPGTAWRYYVDAVAGGMYALPGFDPMTARDRFMSECSTLVATRRAEQSALTNPPEEVAPQESSINPEPA